MISQSVRIERLTMYGRLAAVLIDLSDKPERMTALLDALQMGKLAALGLTDCAAGDAVTLALSDRTAYEADPQTLRLSPGDMGMLKDMLIDVVIGNTFPGYHLDLEAASGKGTVDVTFIIMRY